MNQAARSGCGLSVSMASHACMGSMTVKNVVPSGAHQAGRSNASVVSPPAKVVTPPPWTPMLPVSACSVSIACMVRSPWYQWERANPARMPTGRVLPQSFARARMSAAGMSVIDAVYSGVYLATASASTCIAVRAWSPPAVNVPRSCGFLAPVAAAGLPPAVATT